MKKLVIIVTMFLMTFSVFAAGQSEEPAVSADAKSKWEGQSIEVLIMGSNTLLEVEKLTPEFEEKYGVEVNVTILAPQGYDSKAEVEMIASKGAYSAVWAPWRIYHRWQRAGFFEPLDQFINDPEVVDKNQLAIEGLAKASLDAFTHDGSLYALPVLEGFAVMHYRKDILEAAGISNPPETWEELYEQAKQIQGMTFNGKTVYGVGLRASQNGGGVGFHFPMVLKSYGGSLVADYPSDMHPALDSKTAIDTAEFYASLINDVSAPGSQTAHWADNVLAYQQGLIAFLIEGQGLTGQILDPNSTTQEVIDNTGFALVPAGPSGRISAGAVHGMIVPKNSPNKELGYKFLEWVTSENTQRRNYKENGVSAVVRSSLLLEPEYKAKFGWGNGQWAEACNETTAIYNPQFRPMCPEWRSLEEIFARAMSEVITGQSDASTALPAANKDIDKLMKESGYY